MKKRIVRALSRTVDNAVLLTLLVCLLLAGYALWDTHELLAAANANQFTAYKPSTEDRKSFEELRAMNPDVIGWLTIYDTTIDYPVLRSPNSNDDYLSRNAEGEWEGSGSLFLDHNNRSDFSDFNTIIFGHHMAGPAMFGQIDEFLNKDFFDEHEYANLFFSGRDHGLQIFAMIQADGHDMAIYHVPSTTLPARQATLQKIADYAVQVRNLNTGETRQLGKVSAVSPVKTGSVDPSFFGVNENDHIVLMSTCSADITNGRFVLVGKILDHVVPNPFPEEEETRNIFGIDLDDVLDTLLKLPLWQWIALLVALIILVLLLYCSERYRLKKKRERKRRKEAEEAENKE